MKIILNDHRGSSTFKQALGELVEGADTLSLAVSYIQVGGWQLFHHHTSGLSLPKMRIVCTDQMGITPPAAIKLAQSSGVQIRNYAGEVVYHPKVYLAHDRSGRPTRFLLGSANLSSSAFTDSVEAGVLSADAGGLHALDDWFDDLFRNRSAEFTAESLRKMQEKWLAAAILRAQARLRGRRKMPVPAVPEALPPAPEDLDTLEDVFATIQLPIGLLNIDYARNNVRSIDKVREVMANPARASSKQRSELKLLGFMREGNLTALGRAAATARTNESVARLWCEWLQRTPDGELAEVNPKLLDAKRVFPQFWRLKEDVRDYFLANAQSPQDHRTLQTIELLCNARYFVQELSLDDMRALSRLLSQPQHLPEYIRDEVAEYFDNKGVRSWGTTDRRVVPSAWKEAE